MSITHGACESAHFDSVISAQCKCCYNGNSEGAPLHTIRNCSSQLAVGERDGDLLLHNCGEQCAPGKRDYRL